MCFHLNQRLVAYRRQGRAYTLRTRRRLFFPGLDQCLLQFAGIGFDLGQTRRPVKLQWHWRRCP